MGCCMPIVNVDGRDSESAVKMCLRAFWRTRHHKFDIFQIELRSQFFTFNQGLTSFQQQQQNSPLAEPIVQQQKKGRRCRREMLLTVFWKCRRALRLDPHSDVTSCSRTAAQPAACLTSSSHRWRDRLDQSQSSQLPGTGDALLVGGKEKDG